LRLPRVVASGRTAGDKAFGRHCLASLFPGDGLVGGKHAVWTRGREASRLPLERWPTACLRGRSAALNESWRETNRQRSPSLSTDGPPMGRSNQLFRFFLELENWAKRRVRSHFARMSCRANCMSYRAISFLIASCCSATRASDPPRGCGG